MGQGEKLISHPVRFSVLSGTIQAERSKLWLKNGLYATPYCFVYPCLRLPGIIRRTPPHTDAARHNKW